jgi:hypothetical protein
LAESRPLTAESSSFTPAAAPIPGRSGRRAARGAIRR